MNVKTVMQEVGDWLAARAKQLEADAVEHTQGGNEIAAYLGKLLATQFGELAEHILGELDARGLTVEEPTPMTAAPAAPTTGGQS